MIRLCFAVFLMALALSPVSRAAPSNYDDCILENLKGVSDSAVATAIAAACRNKFPPAGACQPRPLEAIEIARVQRGKVEKYMGYAVLEVHNENPNVKIVALQVVVIGYAGGKEVHKEVVPMQPFARGELLIESRLTSEPPSKWYWYIEGGSGCTV